MPLAKIPTDGILSFNFFRRKGHYHKGIDLPAPIGKPIYSVADGIVAQASNEYKSGFSGFGRHVVIKGNDGKWFLHGHLDNTDLEPGDVISIGDKIGTVGRTGFTTQDHHLLIKGPHLHFEIAKAKYPMASQSENKINPATWLAERDLHPFISKKAITKDGFKKKISKILK